MTTTNHPLDAFQGPLRTRVGAARGGEYAIFRGQDIHKDLVDIHWVDLYFFAVTGKRFSPAQIKVFNAFFGFTSYPDSRIWNNRVAALAGATRSTASLAVSAASAVSEANLFGGQSVGRALEFLQRAIRSIEDGEELEGFVVRYLSRHRNISGFGRPLTARDERIEPMLSLLTREGFEAGLHLRTLIQVEQLLQAGRWRYRMNYAGLTAAVWGDFGLTPSEAYLGSYPAFIPGMVPCFLEALEKPAGAIMPVSCNGLSYTGPTARDWS